ncbi:MAG: rod-binding protein [Syntrophomonadaceae bacterium]|jgi:flagellar protein FlgJ|nr:rod-binding protein [Syntrophomonadaceae bacterium]
MAIKIDNMSSADPYSIMNGSLSAQELAPEKDFEKILRDIDVNKEKNEKKLMESCQQLEALFINKVMEAMRATVSYSDLVNRGLATDIWESMLFEEYAEQASKTGNIGIAQMLYKQLSSNL